MIELFAGGGRSLSGLNYNKFDGFRSDFSGSSTDREVGYELYRDPSISHKMINDVWDINYSGGFDFDYRFEEVRKITRTRVDLFQATTRFTDGFEHITIPTIERQPFDRDPTFKIIKHGIESVNLWHPLFTIRKISSDSIDLKAITISDCEEVWQRNKALPAPKGLREGVISNEPLQICLGPLIPGQ